MKVLEKARLKNLVVGIYSPALGEGMFFVGVEDLYNVGREDIIALKPYDCNGILLLRNQIALSEVKSVTALNFEYTNPLLKRRAFA